MAPELTVRPATLVDTTALSAFAARTFREAFSHTVSPDAMAQYLQHSFHEAQVATDIVDPDTVFLLATDSSGGFAGYCRLHFGSSPPPADSPGIGGGTSESSPPVERDVPVLSPPTPPESAGGGRPEIARIPVKLWRLYTAREWQGRGVGAQLLEYAAMIASKRRGGTLWLTVNTGNTGAVRFYERNSFSRTGFTTFDLGGEIQHDFIMERVLPRSSRAYRPKKKPR